MAGVVATENELELDLGSPVFAAEKSWLEMSNVAQKEIRDKHANSGCATLMVGTVLPSWIH